MSGEIRKVLGRFLGRGPCLIGQVRILSDYSLSHIEDAPKAQREIFTNPHDAIEIAKYDDYGKYRPLKTAPNLRHGWRLDLISLEEASLALDFLYPAALGTALALARSELKAVDLRQTLARQSGMYAVVKKITDEQAEAMIAKTCNHGNGCLRHILWSISPGKPASLTCRESAAQHSENEIPILCAEACNLLVAAGRNIVKTRVP